MGYLSCSKLDKDINCINEASGCFRADKTAPKLQQAIDPLPYQPGSNTISTVSKFDLMFSEELNNPKPADFIFSGPGTGTSGITVNSLEKIDKYSYRLHVSASLETGDIFLDFPNLRDYNNNKITGNTQIRYYGNVDIAVPFTVNRNGISATSGYDKIDVNWSYVYIPPSASTTIYTLKRTNGSSDCNSGSTITWSAVNTPIPVPASGTTVTSGTPYSFSFDTNDITTSGDQVLLICISNATHNKRGTAVISFLQNSSAPTTTLSPTFGPSGSPKALTFTCAPYMDKIIYSSDFTSGSGIDPVVGSPTDPTFNTATGAVTSGSLYDPNNKPLTPYVANPTHSRFEFRCIDRAGNIEAIKNSGPLNPDTYVIDSNLPEVTITHIYRQNTTREITGVSNRSGAHEFADIIWHTNQVNKPFELRLNSTSCTAANGTIIANGTTPTNANEEIKTTISFNSSGTLPTVGAISVGVNPLRLCVQNGALYGQDMRNLIRDDTVPTTTTNIAGGSYGAVQNVVITCNDTNPEGVIYDVTKADGTTLPPAPTGPLYSPLGVRVSGFEHAGPVALENQKTTTLNWRCIDQGGNESTLGTATYTIDSVIPLVNVTSQERTAVSNLSGAFATVQINWTTDRPGLTYEIRNSGNCNGGLGGGGVAGNVGSATRYQGTAAASNAQTLSIANGDFPTIGATYALKVCVFNGANLPGYQASNNDVLRDETRPTIANASVNISPVDATTFNVSWSAASDDIAVVAYRIFRSTTSGVYGVNPDYTAVATSTSLVMPDTQKYFLRIIPVDAAGNTPGGVTPHYNEISTKPSITLVVAGLDTANSKTFNLTDGASSATISANGTSTWTTSLVTNATYRFRVSAQPVDQVCSIRQRQFGSFVSDLTLNVDCTDGYIVSGTFQKKPAAPLDYRLYRGKTSTVASNATSGLGTLTPGGLAFSGNGSLYVSEVSTNRIMRVNQGTGAVTNSSGDGTAGTVDGISTAARFNNPSFMASDGTNLYVSQVGTGLGSDSQDAIRKVDGIGTVTTLVTSTDANDPEGIVISGDLLYWANRATHQIKSYNITTGDIAVVAGTGGAGTGDGAASSATFNQPFGIAIIGNKLYVTDFGSHRIRVIDLGSATVSTLSGGVAGFQDGATGSARFNAPGGILTDGRDLYISEYSGARIRKIRLDRTAAGTNHMVSTLAGEGIQATGATGTGANARFNGLVVLATDGRSIFASDEVDSKIRKITDDGVVGYWPLDGTPVDHSSDGTGSFNMTLSTATTNVTGRYGGTDLAYRFSGFSLSTPDQNQFDVGASYTISTWIYPNASGGMRIVDKITAGSCDGFLLDTLGTNNKIRFSYCFGANHLISSTIVPVNQWTHVTATFSSTQRRARIYVNGRLDAEADTGAGTTPTNALPLRIGVDSTGANLFSGAMAGVRLYNRALTDAEVADLAQDANSATVGSLFSNSPVGLLAHYTFNGGAPAAPAGPVGANLGSVGMPVTGADGDTGGATNLTSNEVNAAAPGLPIANNPRTLCLWYNPQIVQSNRVLLMHGANAVNQGFGITLTSASQLQFFNWGGPNVFFSYASQLRSWQHVCGTLTGSTVEMFVNGASIGTNTGTIGSINTPLSGAIHIGSAVDGNPPLRFNGYIDDVRIYDSVLSAAQIRHLAAAVPAGLVAHLDYNGDTTDSSGYANTVINNGATPTDDRYGTNSRAYKFNGTSEEMRLNAAARMASDATFALWINPSTTPGSLAGLFDNWNGDGSTGGATGGGIVFNGPTGLRVFARGNGAINDCDANWMPPTGAYRHIAATIRSGSPGNISVYVDGSLISSCNPANLQPAFNNSVNFSIGRNIWGSGLNGNIDDVRLYNRALSAAEVRALVQQPNKRVYLTATQYGGNLGGVAGADTKCNWAGDGNKPGGGTWKAMLTSTNTTVVRRPCTSVNCLSNGVAESVDWPLRPNVTYMLSNNSAPSFTANWYGVFDLINGANNDNSTGLNTLTNAINGGAFTAWTGLIWNWASDIAQCGDWDNNVSGLGGPWPNKGVYGQSDLNYQTNGSAPGMLYTGWGDNLCGSMQHRLYCVEQ